MGLTYLNHIAMWKRKLRFVTEKSDYVALANPAHLPQIAITILAEEEARFIAVYDGVEDNMTHTIFVAHYNYEAKGDLKDRYTYCWFDGSKNVHLQQYRAT